MAASADFLHDEAVVDALLDELGDHLPASWTKTVGLGGNRYFSLKRREFGDLRDYKMEPLETWKANAPLVFVKSVSNNWDRQRSGLGGKQAIRYVIRTVHMWAHDQCRDKTSGAWVNPARSRCQRLKVLNKALFNSAQRNLGDPTLTTDDAGMTADVNAVEYVAGYLEGIEDIEVLPDRYYAVAIDLSVVTTTR